MIRRSIACTDELEIAVMAEARRQQQETVARLLAQGVKQAGAVLRRVLHLADHRSIGSPSSR